MVITSLVLLAVVTYIYYEYIKYSSGLRSMLILVSHPETAHVLDQIQQQPVSDVIAARALREQKLINMFGTIPAGAAVGVLLATVVCLLIDPTLPISTTSLLLIATTTSAALTARYALPPVPTWFQAAVIVISQAAEISLADEEE